MRDIEYKAIRFLIFIAILFLNYQVLLLLTSFIAPEGFLNDVKRMGGFFINLLGLHALFAFGTFYYSRMYLNMKIKFYLLGLSLFTPVMYLFFNIEYLYNIEIPDISILIATFFIINLLIKDLRHSYIRQYLNVLIDPFYKDDIEPNLETLQLQWTFFRGIKPFPDEWRRNRYFGYNSVIYAHFQQFKGRFEKPFCWDKIYLHTRLSPQIFVTNKTELGGWDEWKKSG